MQIYAVRGKTLQIVVKTTLQVPRLRIYSKTALCLCELEVEDGQGFEREGRVGLGQNDERGRVQGEDRGGGR